ncbi:MAG: PspC domain-containing protein, partial [Serratia symbiotica]|nr:PspC domain-containing protein [Serratia symbiotica]
MSNILGSKKLYRVPEEGRVKGVCAGLAHYFDVPVRLIRVMAVLSLFFGRFFLKKAADITLVLLFVLSPPPHFVEENKKKTPPCDRKST